MTQEETAQHSAIVLPFICHRDHATVAFVAAMSGLDLAYKQPIEPPQSAPAEVVKFASTAIRENVVFHKEKHRVDLDAKKPCLVVPFSPLHQPPSISTVTPFPASTKRKVTRWNDLTEAARFRAASEYAERADGLAVTLNLSIGREASYLSDDRQTKITRLFQNRLNKELKASGLSGLPYAFSFELSPDGRLHLHGVIDGYGHDRDAIADALRKAAGEIPGRAKARQVKLNLVHDGAGWASYVAKERKRTAKELDLSRVTIMSQSMSRLARQYHNEARNALVAA